MRKALFICIVFAFFVACKVEQAPRYIYSAAPANINNFTKKGNSKLNATYFGDGKSENGGVQVQAAYALSNHWAAMASYTNKWEQQTERYDTLRFHFGWPPNSTAVETNVFDSSVIKYQRVNCEVGLGYYYQLSKHPKTIFYIYGGLGFGKQTMADNGLDSNSNAYTRYYSGNITNYFLQFGYNFRTSDNFCLSIGNKLTTSVFKQANTTYSKQELDYFHLNKTNNNSLVIWEPYINFQLGISRYKWAKLNIQALASASSLGYNYPKANKLSLSIGFSFDICKTKKLKP